MLYNRLKLMVLIAFMLFLGVAFVHATPSTQIWNPSTDIQAVKTFHLGIDNYFSVSGNDTKAYAMPTDIGLTYGLFKNLEAGIDIMEPLADPLFLNVKYGVPETEQMPFSAAVGGFNFGGTKDKTDSNILYGVAAKNAGKIGRLSLGYYSGNDKVLVDETGAAANTGVIATWDKALSDKVWASVDYASGKSSYGNISIGGSYLFAPNTSVIFGYVIYNNDKVNVNNQFTTQLDINF
jgi:hypothetical protein